jgi:hypothetical protein
LTSQNRTLRWINFAIMEGFVGTITGPAPAVRVDSGAVSERVAPPGAGLASRVAPWALVGILLVAALLWVHTPETHIARYAVYWVLCVALPGTLVYRALRGSTGNLPEDVGYGSVAGLALNLVAWALFVGAGVGSWLWAWPIPVLAAFAAVPALRRHWRIADPRPLPLRWSWSVAAVMIFTIALLALAHWAPNPLPPATHSLFGDIYYHWANAAELRRTVRPTSPQVAGVPLQYHWFSDAYRASASLITGVPLGSVMLRLWVGPVALTSVLVIAALARKVSGVWWTGPLAAFIAVGLDVASIWPRFGNYVATVVPWYSPTLTFSIPIVTVTLALLVDLARGHRLGRAWILLGLLLVVSAGSKSSSLPVLGGGLGLAVVATWLRTRRAPRGLLLATAGLIATLLVTAPALAGGMAGAGIQLGSTFTFKAEYIRVAGWSHIPGTGGLLPPSMSSSVNSVRLILPALAFCFLLGQIGRLAGFALVLRRSARRDPALWLLLGTAVAGMGGMLVISHISNGQPYFWYSALPAASVLSAWLLAELKPARSGRTMVVAGLAVGAVVGGAVWRFGPGRESGAWKDHWPALLAEPVIALLAVAAVGIVVWYLLRRRWPVLVGGGLALIVAASIGLGFDTTLRSMEGRTDGVYAGRLPSSGTKSSFWVTAEEMRAADWLAKHARDGEYVATNVHCELIRTDDKCINRSFWVSALTEHPVVLEGWAYQAATQAKHGQNNLPSFRAPSPEPERQRINDAVFGAPTAVGIAELRNRYKARWLYADERASHVSPDLADLAQVRYRAGTVTIYELTPA